MPCGELPAAIAAPAAPAAPVSTAARPAIRLRARLIDVQRSTVEVSTVESADCGVTFRVNTHFDEGEASGLPGVAIRHDIDAINGSV